MRVLWKLAAAALIAMLLTFAGTGKAMADPINSPKALPFAVTCEGERLNVISPSEPSSALLIEGENTVGIGTVVTLTTTYIDPQSGEPVTDVQTVMYGPGHGAARGVQGKLTRCTETVIIEDPALGTVTVVFAGDFLLTPR